MAIPDYSKDRIKMDPYTVHYKPALSRNYQLGISHRTIMVFYTEYLIYH